MYPGVASFTPSDSASSPSPDQSISSTPAHGHAHDFMPLTYPYVLSRDQNTTTPTMMSELTEEIPESPWNRWRRFTFISIVFAL